jgi:hypothetical protein
MIAGADQLLLLRDGGSLREGVARRSRTSGGTQAGPGLLTNLISLMDQETESQSVPSLGLIQPRRSIKGSETPHCRPGPRRSRAPRGSAPSIGSTVAGTVSSTTHCTSSRSPAPNTTRRPRSTSLARKPKARPPRARCARWRHLARRFYHLLAEPPADHNPQAVNGKPIAKPKLPAIPERPRPRREVQQIRTAPYSMVCVR